MHVGPKPASAGNRGVLSDVVNLLEVVLQVKIVGEGFPLRVPLDGRWP
jgi:hypothetical protein